jgi:hypothetical protein
MALTGMILFIFCLFYPNWRVYVIEKSEIEILGKINIIKVESTLLDNELDRASTENLKRDSVSSETIKIRKNLIPISNYTYEELAHYFKDKQFRDAYEFVLDHEQQFYGNNKRGEETDEIRKKNDKIRINLVEVNNLQDLAAFEKKRAGYISDMGLIGRFITALISILGFIFWYVNYQSVQDKILKQQLNIPVRPT